MLLMTTTGVQMDTLHVTFSLKFKSVFHNESVLKYSKTFQLLHANVKCKIFKFVRKFQFNLKLIENFLREQRDLEMDGKRY